MSKSFLEDAVEDAIVSMVEQEIVLPSTIDVWYTEEEWVSVEAFHRLRIRTDRKLGIQKDRYPFIRMQVLGLAVNLAPEPKYVETIQ